MRSHVCSVMPLSVKWTLAACICLAQTGCFTAMLWKPDVRWQRRTVEIPARIQGVFRVTRSDRVDPSLEIEFELTGRNVDHVPTALAEHLGGERGRLSMEISGLRLLGLSLELMA